MNNNKLVLLYKLYFIIIYIMNDSIVQDTTSSIIGKSITDQTSNIMSESTNVSSSQSSFNWYAKILFVLFIFALVGINIFGYASLITENISEMFGGPFRQIFGLFGFYTGETIKQTAEMSAEGTKFGADIAKDVVVNTVDLTTEQTKNTQDTIDEIDTELVHQSSHNEPEQPEQPPYLDRDELMASFDAAKENRENSSEQQRNYIEDDAGSTIQNGRNNNGKGWCYIGEDSGFRSCVEVGNGQECMSGDVFPSKDKCINPNLRF